MTRRHVSSANASWSCAKAFALIIALTFALEATRDNPPDPAMHLDRAVLEELLAFFAEGKGNEGPIAQLQGLVRKHLAAGIILRMSELRPDGMILYYEGDEPEAFAKRMVKKFGFDPRDGEGWEECHSFHCPPHALDEVYWKYQIGT